jgi:phage terminase small subunit
MGVPRLKQAIKKDQQTRRIVRRLQRACPHLDAPEYTPILRSYARLTLLIERAYARLRDGDIMDRAGEIRHSVDTLRRLMLTQTALARELGLTPAARAGLGGKAVFEIPDRIAHRVIEIHASRAANGQGQAPETE